MSIVRPSLSAIIEAIRADGDALLGGIDARIERGIEDVLLTAQAGGIHGANGRIQQIADDAFPDTARSDALERWAGIFGISRGPATFGQGWVGASGMPFVYIANGTLFRRSDGVEFEAVQIGYLDDGTEIDSSFFPVAYSTLGLGGSGYAIPVRAVVSGSEGNTAAAATVSFVSPIAGVPPVLAVDLAIAGAVDFELDAALRARLLATIQNPPQGGTAAEYESWSLAATTPDDPVTRAFVVPPAAGDNDVTVYVVDDGGGIPSANPPQATAQAKTNVEIAVDARRPLSSQRTISDPTFVAITMTIVLSPDTATIRTAIENEIDGFLIDNAEPGLELPLSLMQSVVQLAAGSGDAQITAPSNNWVPAPAALLYRGAITWV